MFWNFDSRGLLEFAPLRKSFVKYQKQDRLEITRLREL